MLKTHKMLQSFFFKQHPLNQQEDTMPSSQNAATDLGYSDRYIVIQLRFINITWSYI